MGGSLSWWWRGWSLPPRSCPAQMCPPSSRTGSSPAPPGSSWPHTTTSHMIYSTWYCICLHRHIYTVLYNCSMFRYSLLLQVLYWVYICPLLPLSLRKTLYNCQLYIWVSIQDSWRVSESITCFFLSVSSIQRGQSTLFSVVFTPATTTVFGPTLSSLYYQV